jgi:hypothetical protein
LIRVVRSPTSRSRVQCRLCMSQLRPRAHASPRRHRGDGDNLPAHKVANVREIIQAAGASLRYLPSYSPQACSGTAPGFRRGSQSPGRGDSRRQRLSN